MNVPMYFLAESRLHFVWTSATAEGQVIIGLLAIFSIVAWSTMVSKAVQMRRAKKLNLFFDGEFREQQKDRKSVV